jgi:hypothetical protein
VSAKITVVTSHRTYQLKRNLAERKVKRGGFRWHDNFTIIAIETLSSCSALRLRPIYVDGKIRFAEWHKKLSGGCVAVMQATVYRA